MIVDYGYINARMRGMKSRLLTKKALDDLIFRPDLDSLIAELEKSGYKDDILEAKAQCSGGDGSCSEKKKDKTEEKAK